MVRVDDWRGFGGLAGGIVEKQHDVAMQRFLIALQSQSIVAALIDDLPGDGALTVERVGGHDRPFQRQHFQKFRHGVDFFRLGVRGDLRQRLSLIRNPSDLFLLPARLEGAVQAAPVDRELPGPLSSRSDHAETV